MGPRGCLEALNDRPSHPPPTSMLLFWGWRVFVCVPLPLPITLPPPTSRQVHYCGSWEQDVVCIDSRRVLQSARSNKTDPTAHGVYVDPRARPTTSITASAPGTT